MFSEYMKPETIQALDGIIKKLKQDYDATWIYTGGKREGKSTLAQHNADYITTKLKSNIWLCFFYWSYPGEKENIEKIRKDLGLESTNIYPASVQYAQEYGKRFDNIVVDEAVDFLEKGNWNTKEARTFTINHDEFGYKNFVYHLLMPTFGFVKGFREERVHLWMYIPKRGRVHFYKPKKTPKKIMWPDSPIWTDHFPKLDSERERAYSETKHHMLRIRRQLTGDYDLKEKMLQITFKIFEVFPNARQKDVAEVFGVSEKTISNWINERKNVMLPPS